jgi:hypothetical protein
MSFFKACPKCQGDMHLNRDSYGAFVKCLQCGLLRDVGIRMASSSVDNSRLAGKLLMNGIEDLQLTA